MSLSPRPSFDVLRLGSFWAALRARWQHLLQLPRALWRVPIQHKLHAQQLQQLLDRQQVLEAWVPERLPFALHQPNVEWLHRAEARLGQAASALTPVQRAESFYSYFSEMAGDTRPVLLQQYQAYLPLLQQTRQRTAAHPQAPWLDIGCGAGEFLHFLAGQGWPVEGVDMNAAEVARCQAQGLPVWHADALTHLRQSSSALCGNGYAGISLLQVIEHLPPDQVLPLLQACIQRLVPGGLLLVETVNLRHALAFSGFYTDPTHKVPLPDNYLAFALQWLGLQQVGVMYTLPAPVALVVKSEQTAHYLNYAVHGHVAPDGG